MKAYRAVFPLAAMCRVLGLSSSGYYDWLRRAPSAQARRNAELKIRIKAIWRDSDETYGCPRIHAALVANGARVSRKRVARLMKELGIQGVTRRRFKTGTTKRDAKARPAPDLVNRDFSAKGPNQLWVADITYVPTWTGWLYLAVVLDTWSRRIVGSDKYAGSDDFADIKVPPGGSFADMVALKGTKEIGDGINKVIGRLADANGYLLKGVIDQADFNDESRLGRGKEMQDRLSKLVGIFEGLDFRANRAHGDDLLGDAYEYLMRHFATQSGKSKGQFYTPAEVSRIMAQVIEIGPDTRRDHTVYDPTCGSGSLLIKAADEAPHGLTVYGQEKDVATWTMARINMILHGRVAAEIKRDNTLAAPRFTEGPGRLKRFDFAVANPPFSDKAWTNGLDPANDEYRRFEYGEPPAKNGDLAFLLHLVASLNSTGKGTT